MKNKIVAFIPVRGGSKSIPLKNIKALCGKPLVCWNIEALENCALVDEIIVATDSDAIDNVVSSKKYRKTSVYRRTKENASDTASTESVMLEYINNANISADTIFMLVQATSPLTSTKHFTEAVQMYYSGKYDSVLTCVRNHRFFWNDDGTSMNYDYTNRPRRQNFNGIWMENGAFYINTVQNILLSNNRLSGRIGIYEMPECTSMEIDDPIDWVIIEQVMKSRILTQHATQFKNIKLFVSDVDGTLTDGGMYYSESGEELKKFNTKDGMGFQLLREAGIKTGIITTENTNIVANRAKKMKIDYLYQGIKNRGKLEAVKEMCVDGNFSLGEVAYIGDDINCRDVLMSVGVKACPFDAVQEIKELPNIIQLNNKGGEGAVREFIEKLLYDKCSHV